MSTLKEARNDAREYARAKMFYGEGAGTRRKLIQATVDSRAHQDPAYARAFHAELARQDMAKHAKKAMSERSRKDKTQAVSKNVKGLLTGNNKTLNTSILVISTAAYIAHQTGYDVVLIEKSKAVVADVKARYRRRKNMRVVNDVYNVTNIRH